MQINPDPSLHNLGGKAYQLFRLKGSCDVPDFFVVSFNDPSEIDDPYVQSAILEYSNGMNFGLMAVRSSASTEDSVDASFAGMFFTMLGVHTDNLIEAMKSVLESIKSERVSSYAEAHGYDVNKIRMAVIIQKIVRSRVSGVCFTRTQNRSNSLLVEACYGLGEALVSGQVTPDSYVVDRSNLSIIEESIGYQKVMLKITEDSQKPSYEDIPFHKRNARKLTHDQVRAIAQTCLSIEKRLDFNVADIEWAFEGDILYILQARPYTAFAVGSDTPYMGGDAS